MAKSTPSLGVSRSTSSALSSLFSLTFTHLHLSEHMKLISIGYGDIGVRFEGCILCIFSLLLPPSLRRLHFYGAGRLQVHPGSEVWFWSPADIIVQGDFRYTQAVKFGFVIWLLLRCR